MGFWKERAEELAVKELSEFGLLFKKHLEANPELKLVQQLKSKGEFEAFLLVQQESAMQEYRYLLAQGTPTQSARELVLSDYLASFQPVEDTDEETDSES